MHLTSMFCHNRSDCRTLSNTYNEIGTNPTGNFQDLELESNANPLKLWEWKGQKNLWPQTHLDRVFPQHILCMHEFLPYWLFQNTSVAELCSIKWTNFTLSSPTDTISNDLFFCNNIYTQSKLERKGREDINSTEMGSSFMLSL